MLHLLLNLIRISISTASTDASYCESAVFPRDLKQATSAESFRTVVNISLKKGTHSPTLSVYRDSSGKIEVNARSAIPKIDYPFAHFRRNGRVLAWHGQSPVSMRIDRAPPWAPSSANPDLVDKIRVSVSVDGNTTLQISDRNEIAVVVPFKVKKDKDEVEIFQVTSCASRGDEEVFNNGCSAYVIPKSILDERIPQTLPPTPIKIDPTNDSTRELAIFGSSGKIKGVLPPNTKIQGFNLELGTEFSVRTSSRPPPGIISFKGKDFEYEHPMGSFTTAIPRGEDILIVSCHRFGSVTRVLEALSQSVTDRVTKGVEETEPAAPEANSETRQGL